MSEAFQYSFPRYLAAKKSVDDRALNRPVWQTLVDGVSAGAGGAATGASLEVLEIGAGTGTMVERMLAWGGLQQAHYTALDASAENIAAALARLPEWAGANGYTCQHSSPTCLQLVKPHQHLHLDLETSDLFEFIQRQQGRRCWDVLIAHAFLDLVDIPSALPQVLHLLNPGGWFYFTINFDGATLFEPAIDRPFDDLVERLYHETMDERLTNGRPSGDSRAGRHLFAQLKAAGASLLASGASDWVVFAGPDGRYPADEAYFLHFIIHTLQQALQDHPQLDPGRFRQWVEQRHAQIERGELVYIAHQLDFVGRTGLTL